MHVMVLCVCGRNVNRNDGWATNKYMYSLQWNAIIVHPRDHVPASHSSLMAGH